MLQDSIDHSLPCVSPLFVLIVIFLEEVLDQLDLLEKAIEYLVDRFT